MEGKLLGWEDGIMEGKSLGCELGWLDTDGAPLGCELGNMEGVELGFDEGC